MLFKETFAYVFAGRMQISSMLREVVHIMTTGLERVKINKTETQCPY
jgi:hypothetical protein